MIPSAQVSQLTTGSITLPSARGAFAEGDFISIASSSGSGSSQSITFSSVPQTYKHLQIRGIGQASYSSNDEGSVGIRLNGDTGSNYTRKAGPFGGGATVSDGIILSTVFAEAGDGAFLNTGNTVGANIIDILNYTNSSAYKSIRGIGATDRNGAGAIRMGAGLWLNTAAVTSVTVYQQNANFTTQSFYALYGIG
jgi:hypothetical protein